MATITLVNFLQKVSIILDDHISSTTTSAGNAGGTTMIDSALKKYPNGYFGDPNSDPEWWAYISTTLLPIKDFTSSTGTLTLHTAYGSPTQIASSTAYSLHNKDRDKKILACNLSLYECFPDFYLRVDDATTLDGTGSSTNKYTVPSAFTEFPDQIWALDDATTAVDRTQITDYEKEEIDGSWYFYANITTGDDILLIGKTFLTQFTVTTDSSTTTLNDLQANTVAYKAASIFCRIKAGTVNSQDAGRFKAMEADHEMTYQRLANNTRMPRILPLKADFDSWANRNVRRVWPQP